MGRQTATKGGEACTDSGLAVDCKAVEHDVTCKPCVTGWARFDSILMVMPTGKRQGIQLMGDYHQTEQVRQDAVSLISLRENTPVLSTVHRAEPAGCLVAYALAPDWGLMRTHGWDCAPHDCVRERTGAPLAIRHGAARQQRQTDDCDRNTKIRSPVSTWPPHPRRDICGHGGGDREFTPSITTSSPSTQRSAARI